MKGEAQSWLVFFFVILGIGALVSVFGPCWTTVFNDDAASVDQPKVRAP